MEEYKVEGFVVDFVHEVHCAPVHCPSKDKLVHKASRSTYCYAYDKKEFDEWRKKLTELRNLAENAGFKCSDVTLKRPNPVAKTWSSCNMTSEDPETGKVDVFDRKVARTICFNRMEPILNKLRGKKIAQGVRDGDPDAIRFSLESKIRRAEMAVSVAKATTGSNSDTTRAAFKILDELKNQLAHMDREAEKKEKEISLTFAPLATK